MGKIADVNFKGDSGKSFTFGAYTLDTSFKNVGAVYIFTKRTLKDGKGSHDSIYIGQTDKLADRISNHEKWLCLKKKDVNCICVHVDEKESSRLDKETDLRHAALPPFSRTHS